MWSAARPAKISMILCMPERVSGGDENFKVSAIDGINGRDRYLARLGSEGEERAVRMLRSAQVRKAGGSVNRNTFAGTAKAVLEGRALETIPIMQYVWEG